MRLISNLISFNYPLFLVIVFSFSSSWYATCFGLIAAIWDLVSFFGVEPFDVFSGFLAVMCHIAVGYDFLPKFLFITDGSKQVLQVPGCVQQMNFAQSLDIFSVLNFWWLSEAGNVGFPTASGDSLLCDLPHLTLEFAIFIRCRGMLGRNTSRANVKPPQPALQKLQLGFCYMSVIIGRWWILGMGLPTDLSMFRKSSIWRFTL